MEIKEAVEIQVLYERIHEESYCYTDLLRRGEIHSQGRTRQMLTSRNLSDFFGTPVFVRWYNNTAWLRLTDR